MIKEEFNEYWNKYRIPMGIAEIFSIFLERLTKNCNYLRSLFDSVNYDDKIINKVISRTRFMHAAKDTVREI